MSWHIHSPIRSLASASDWNHEVSVVGRLDRSGEVDLDPIQVSPLVEHAAGELRPIVDPQALGQPLSQTKASSASVILTGAAGANTFLFNTALGSGNVDCITDFNRVDDTIQLENAIFTRLATIGTLNAEFSASNTTGTATDSNDYVVYNTSTGALSYDADGSGAGAAVQFALLGNEAALTAADFFVV